MRDEQLAGLEAVLYASGDDGLTIHQIAEIIGVTDEVAFEIVADYRHQLEEKNRGFNLIEVAGAYQLATKPEMNTYITKLVQSPKPASLSQASLETLAIIAYNQPISRAEIENVRGVKSEKAIHTLIARDMIKEVGRAEGTGRAILYGVTDAFLNHFGLNTLDELPPLPETSADESDDSTDLFYEKFKQTMMDF